MKQHTTKIGRECGFIMIKTDEIFNQLFSGGQLKLLGDHKLSSLEEIASKQ